MRLEITTSGDFSNTINWLKESQRKQPRRTLRRLGEEGIRALKAATPVGETGETARGWQYRITSDRTGSELYYYNNAHRGTQVNVAKLIQLGHGTGTGGYVPPRNYIKPALGKLFAQAGDQMAEEMFK